MSKGGRKRGREKDLHELSLRLGRVGGEDLVQPSHEQHFDRVCHLLRVAVREHPLIHPVGGEEGGGGKRRRRRG